MFRESLATSGGTLVEKCFYKLTCSLTLLSSETLLIAQMDALCVLQIINALEEDPSAQRMQLAIRLQGIAAALENKVTDL